MRFTFTRKLALVVLGVIFLVLGVMLFLGLVLGDGTGLDTDDPNGGGTGIAPVSQR